MGGRSHTRPVLAALLVLVAAACGSSGSQVAVEGPLGRGADQVWIFWPPGPPKNVVVFLHGLGPGELTPANHRPWLQHLAEHGSVVLYPRYEARLGDRGAVLHALAGVRAGLRRVKTRGLPLVAIGYSRGGELVADYAAVARGVGPAPAAVLSVFPAAVDPVDPPLDLRTIDAQTRITILLGDRDEVVGGSGGRQLLQRLEAADFPPSRISLVVVRSQPGFVVNHTAPLQVSAMAQDVFWARADRIVESARR